MAAPPDPSRPGPPRPAPRPRRDFAAEEAAERRLADIRLQLRRGQTAEAEAGARALLAERPGDAPAHEMLGDVLAARGDDEGAGAAYRQALAHEPGRASAEGKFATLTLARAERQRRQTLGVSYAAADTALVRREGGGRGAWVPVVGSLLCPGLGQIAQGQYVKGAVLLGVLVLGLGLLAALEHGASGRSFFGPAFWVVAALLAADWVYAVADAALAPRSGDSV
jgi:hypothetical protein